ncbi:MAG: helix-turn-helix domain-containing protein [Anaerolineales bacterium]|nr:helix-turn-helix domain-containing protein [Anaerolineales bacterium]
MNDAIVKRIKEARQERGLTQHDLAEHLGRSTAAISELERGKVQVTAADLYLIAQLLNKPIEYFFGEEFGDSEIQDLIAVMRKQPLEVRTQSIQTTKLILQMQQIGDIVKNDPDKELPFDEIQTFFTAFLAFSKQINELTVKMNDIRDKLIQELKSQGVDLSN